MANKGIDISIGASFDGNGISQANKALAQMAQNLKKTNTELQRSAYKSIEAFNQFATEADKAACAAGGGYTSLKDELTKIKTRHEEIAAAARKAAEEEAREVNRIRALIIDANKARSKSHTEADEAARNSSISVNEAISATRGNIGAIINVTRKALASFKLFGSGAAAAIGPIGIAISAAVGFFAKLRGTLEKLEEKEREINDNNIDKALKEAAKAQEELAKATANATKALDKQFAAAQRVAESARKVNVANIEADRARALASAAPEDREKISEEYEAKLRNADIEARRESIQASIERKDWDRHLAQQNGDELGRKINRLRRSLKDNADGNDEKYFEALDQIKELKSKRNDYYKQAREIAGDIEETRKEFEMLDAEEAAKEEKRIAEKALKEVEVAEKAAKDKAAIEAREAEKAIEAEKKAREKMEAELHQQRVENARTELAEAQAAGSKQASIISSAQSEFDKAFGLYRDKDAAARAIAEERDYAADYKQLQKDASRYGGKWRIDELASLMAAGDTKGQAAKLEEWRKSSSFTPEVEAMVRASAADQTRTTAEYELRKIAANTEDLAKKLDDLLSLK